jgi:dihydrofolate synthase/folylpolyglutamate synthase
MPLGLVGSHQAGNAHLALRAVGALATRDGWELDPEAIRDGLRGTRLPGRFERRLLADRPVVLDGAHNPMKLAALVATLQELRPGARFPWVLAFKQDKDIDGALRVLAPVASGVVATEFCSDGGDHPAGASVPARRVAAAAAGRGIPAAVERNPVTALSSAAAEPDATVPVVVTGSFHLLPAVHGATVPQ